jgi:hypothetical protein
MYAVVRRYDGVNDPAEAVRRVQEGFIPLLREVPGFVAYYALDAGGGVIVSTSVFQDQAGSEESTKRAADYVRENLAALIPNPPQVTAGEVVASG